MSLRLKRGKTWVLWFDKSEDGSGDWIAIIEAKTSEYPYLLGPKEILTRFMKECTGFYDGWRVLPEGRIP